MRLSAKAHLSKSSPPVTSSRIREISVSVSKISFRRICKPQQRETTERNDAAKHGEKYVKLWVMQNPVQIKSCQLIFIQKSMTRIASKSFHDREEKSSKVLQCSDGKGAVEPQFLSLQFSCRSATIRPRGSV